MTKCMSFGAIDMRDTKEHTKFTHEGYAAGHPWYYHLGGRRLSLKEIRQAAINSGYRGYDSEEIDRIAKMQEPRRSELLRTMRQKFALDLIDDISRYRKLARELVKYRNEGLDSKQSRCCDDIHTNMRHHNLSLTRC